MINTIHEQKNTETIKTKALTRKMTGLRRRIFGYTESQSEDF